jgi:coproporphyrinogen III oxidase-like Fe-S oxidoreductase
MFVGVESFNRQTLLAARQGQNRPEMYRDIVRLCREHGISPHFSNIIGFPQDTEEDVDRHLEMLRELGPTFASFYILCPIPGTEQYDEFVAEGLVTEDNLDRFDTTCLTWRHPHFSCEQLSGLLFRCYRRFYSSGHAGRNLMHLGWRRSSVLAESVGITAMSLFNRYCTWRRTHPMSGGVMPVLLDRVDEYLPLRKNAFGFELAPLPRSLQLVAADSLLKRVVNPHERANSPLATDRLAPL